MKIEYLHRAGGFTHQGPSGTTYEFLEDAEGRRVADVKDSDDQCRFLALTDQKGNPLFVALESPRKPKAAKSEPPTNEQTETKPEADHADTSVTTDADAENAAAAAETSADL